MACTNFPQDGLIPNVTTHLVGEVLYRWSGAVWESTTGPIDASKISWTDKTVEYSLDDNEGFKEALLAEAAIVDNGLPDTAIASQRLDAMKAAFQDHSKQSNLEAVGGHDAIYSRNFKNIYDMIGYEGHALGVKYQVDDYYGSPVKNNSGTMFFEIVSASTGVADGGKFIDIPASAFQLQQIFPSTPSVKMWGAVGNGVANDTLPIKKALLAVRSILMPEGRYRVTEELHTRASTHLHGVGSSSVIVADNVVGAVILTSDGVTANYTAGQLIENFCIQGSATKAGIVFAHCLNSQGRNIRLGIPDGDTGIAFSSPDGFVFEYTWGCAFNNFTTAGANITNAPYKFNDVFLNSSINNIYSSNVSKYSIDYDSTRKEWSIGTGVGGGGISINTAALQGSTVYAMKLKCSKVEFSNMYTENVKNIIHIEKGSSNVRFTRSHLRAGVGNHAMYLGDRDVGNLFNVRNIVFDQCWFDAAPEMIIAGRVEDVMYTNCYVTGGGQTNGLWRRTPETVTNLPISETGVNMGNPTDYSRSLFTCKTNGYSWEMARFKPNANGTFTTQVFTPPEVLTVPAT